ncbi:hypothetical protein VTO42DRAFT_2120 [Malbranchea cinnamomea]
MGDNSGHGAGAEKDMGRPDPALAAADGNQNPPTDDAFNREVPSHVQPLQSFRSQTFTSFSSAAGNSSSAQGGTGGYGDVDAPEELPWGPSHPCFPHMNPHVPIDSAEYANTRIIRIRRDWMIKGDLAPTFSNLYPEILDPLLPEQEFRKVIAKINEEVSSAFDPFSLRNWVDNIFGVLTGWIWDDLGLTGIKSRLRSLENWIESWNRDVGAPEGVKIWSLRSTGYMCLDIQIPDPKVRIVESEPASAPGTRPSTSDVR